MGIRLANARVGMRLVVVAATAAAVGLTTAGQPAAANGGGGTQICRVSVSDRGAQVAFGGYFPQVSGTGRHVAFISRAADLVAGDTNGKRDVFVRDRVAHHTTRVSLSTSGAKGNGSSSLDDLTPDGRYVLFTSAATNLVPGDTNRVDDVFVRDVRSGTTERVSVTVDGGQFASTTLWSAISADGRYVAFTEQFRVAEETWGFDVYVRDRLAEKTSLVSVSTEGVRGNGPSFRPTISGDGRYIVYTSYADNLVPADTGGFADVFIRDQVAGTTELLSTSVTGGFGNEYSANPTISANGRYVAFTSLASNMVFGEVNSGGDVFIRDRATGRTDVVNRSSSGAQGNGGFGSAISADGRFVAFMSSASNLVPGDRNGTTDLFLRDLSRGTTVLVNVSMKGTQATVEPGSFDISDDGHHVAFTSHSPILVPDDTNGTVDAFVRDFDGRRYCSARGHRTEPWCCHTVLSQPGDPAANGSEALTAWFPST
jgi:Tol biopolymer transport system component